MFDQKAGVAEASDSMRDLTGKRILVTAGPTQEAIDPVRYITNHSTGRMGYAIAQRAHERGAEVVLVSGPVSIQAPCGVELVNVVSAQDMFEAVSSRYETCDAVIKAAAVADYRPAQVHEDKVKKKDGEMSILLGRRTSFRGLVLIESRDSDCAAFPWRRAMSWRIPAPSFRRRMSI